MSVQNAPNRQNGGSSPTTFSDFRLRVKHDSAILL
jgi:hypothetical protein